MLWRLLIFLAAAYILYRLFTGETFKRKADKQQAEQKKYETGEMVKDPVCGAFVPVDGDIRVKAEGRLHTFCSYECRDKFLKQMKAGQDRKAVE